MFKFTYTDHLGKKRTSYSTTINEVELSSEFKDSGINDSQVLDIKKLRRTPREDKTFELKERIIFYQFLKGMLNTGIKTPFALDKLSGMFEKKKQKQLLLDMAEITSKGSTLTVALKICPSFSPMELSVLKAGESAGDLQGAITMLVQFLKSKAKLGKDLKSLIIGPAMATMIIYGALYVVIYSLIPSVFYILDFNSLPALSKLIIPFLYEVSKISIFKIFPAVTAALILAIPVFKSIGIKAHQIAYNKVRKYRRIVQIYTNINFTLFYTILDRSKEKPERILNYLKNNSLPPINKTYESMALDVSNGKAVYETMTEKYFSFITMSAFQTGYETGDMESQLGILYQFLQEEKELTDESVKRIVNLTTLALVGTAIVFIMGIVYYPVVTNIG